MNEKVIIEALEALVDKKNIEITKLNSHIENDRNEIGFILCVIAKSNFRTELVKKIRDNNTSPYTLNEESINDFINYFHSN